MSRNRKEGNAFVSIGGKMLFGGLIGGAIGILFAIEDTAKSVENAADYLLNLLVKNYIPVMLVLSLGMLVLNLICYYKLKTYVKAADGIEDEEAFDEIDNNIDIMSTLAITGNSVFFVLVFMNFAINLSLGARDGRLIIYFLPVLMYPFFYVLIVNILKKYDPSKKGNPGTMRFQKDWINSCDEAEKMRIFKSGYQSNQASSIITTIGFGTTAVLANIFDVGTFACFITGIMWLLQCIANGYYTIKCQKDRLS